MATLCRMLLVAAVLVAAAGGCRAQPQGGNSFTTVDLSGTWFVNNLNSSINIVGTWLVCVLGVLGVAPPQPGPLRRASHTHGMTGSG